MVITLIATKLKTQICGLHIFLYGDNSNSNLYWGVCVSHRPQYLAVKWLGLMTYSK